MPKFWLLSSKIPTRAERSSDDQSQVDRCLRWAGAEAAAPVAARNGRVDEDADADAGADADELSEASSRIDDLVKSSPRVAAEVACGHAPGSCRMAGRRAEFCCRGARPSLASRPNALLDQCLDAKCKKLKSAGQPLTARDRLALENLQLGTKLPLFRPSCRKPASQNYQSTILAGRKKMSQKKIWRCEKKLVTRTAEASQPRRDPSSPCSRWSVTSCANTFW